MQNEASLACVPWLEAGWYLEQLERTELRGIIHARQLRSCGDRQDSIARLRKDQHMQRPLQQTALALGVMGTILHLRLLILGRLPAQALATGSHGGVEGGAAERPQAGGARGAAEGPTVLPRQPQLRRALGGGAFCRWQACPHRLRRGPSVQDPKVRAVAAGCLSPTTPCPVATPDCARRIAASQHCTCGDGVGECRTGATGGGAVTHSAVASGVGYGSSRGGYGCSTGFAPCPGVGFGGSKGGPVSGVPYGGSSWAGHAGAPTEAPAVGAARRQQQAAVQAEKAACVRALRQLLRVSCPNCVMVRPLRLLCIVTACQARADCRGPAPQSRCLCPCMHA